MSIYTGKSADGSDMQEAEGMYTDSNIWSNMPFIIRNTHNRLNKDSFICKGKHQYRRVETKEDNIIHISWICQCGRITV